MRREFDIRLEAGEGRKNPPPLPACLGYNGNEETGGIKCIMYGPAPFPLVIDTATGTIAQRMDYDDWGNVLVNTAPDFTPFGYAK